MKRLTDAEASALYRHLTQSADPKDVFLQLLFETGARVSETLTLGSHDLLGASLGIAPLKGSAPRTVTVSPNLAAKLRRLPAACWSAALGAAATLPSRRRALDRHFRGTLAAVTGRQAPTGLHALRHTAFSRLYAATKDLMLVKTWAGHRSIASTVVYMTLDTQARANQTQEDLLKGLVASAE